MKSRVVEIGCRHRADAQPTFELVVRVFAERQESITAADHEVQRSAVDSYLRDPEEIDPLLGAGLGLS
jgi:hypothetical protein